MRIIAHISDLHFGRDNPRAADHLAADLHAQNPHLLVVSGDLTQRARRRQYAAAAAFLQRLPGPQLVIPGNHDIPLFDVIRRFAWPLERFREYLTPDLRPFYQDDEIAVLGINTSRPWAWRLGGFWKDGRISEEQLLDIKLRMGELPPHLFKIVVTHHPFIPPPGERMHGMVGGAGRALAVMQACGVDMLLAGHLHLGYSGDVRTHYEAAARSILSVQAGTAISTRRRHEPNAYNLITLDRGQARIEVRAWNGDRFEPTLSRPFTRVNEIWQHNGAP